ncbi:VanY-A/VanY-F/VanY-M family D-Ala-D-Ala carboxypeptidase [Fredinandcohnia sp. QZ13]|uniref:VanY-A/VanY-F/VanY-M family D-Ala-D-Ala carboxypeptidase n=1 Tax=Fredinandcohnia sp. QZ13 TaxID=3073144 RepID=UPI002853016E|nr:VanY-A/VanY-F/VanY-M family D-Ala-D-Ala carboxypeptidase [Fredinandcohnia sp. QZ13]MDR4886051.1 VanY-A/VanY-F/VanY-M family D-Ala-D-Ala carboxypeptidase [Fredinandcohnia sp. QZ13]
MKKWGFLLVFLSCMSLLYIKFDPYSEPKVVIQHVNQQDNRVNSVNIQRLEIKEDQIYQGNLLLVNNDYPVHHESIKSDVINLYTQNEFLEGYELLNGDIDLSKEIARKFSEMVLAAENEGVSNFVITSGFRDFEEQSALYLNKGSAYALPAGHSEHNLGLSLDIGSTQMMMAEAPEGKWIEKNAWKYGFILRYPENKMDITGIQYEPWHIRYVGLPHSAIMKEKNFVLEEYLTYLKEEKQISASLDGENYTISYYPISKSTTINVPENRYLEISGNNIDGVIVTVFDRKL